MFILDQPYVSEELKQYIVATQAPVLRNQTALEVLDQENCNFVSAGQFAQLFSEGKRMYTCSENSLDWVIQNIKDDSLKSNIERLKNKALFRDLLAPAYPDFFYKRASLEELSSLNTDTFSYPFILKPQVGFFSVGVYPITNELDWQNAVAELGNKAADWKQLFPESVLNTEFILEQYIYGEEVAIDAYYDDQGEAVILNILKHDFDGMGDVSDRFYYTGKAVIEAYLEPLSKWLTEVNQILGIKNFPFHAEIRIDNGHFAPIEFNPLRFAGWCCTDLSYFAFGFYTYDYYLNNKRPDWKTLLEGKDGKYYTLIVMDKAGEVDNDARFDYVGASNQLGTILCLRKINYHEKTIYGFLFTEIAQDDKATMQRIMERDFQQFLK